MTSSTLSTNLPKLSGEKDTDGNLILPISVGELERLVDSINEEVQKKVYEAGMKSKESHVQSLSENA